MPVSKTKNKNIKIIIIVTFALAVFLFFSFKNKFVFSSKNPNTNAVINSGSSTLNANILLSVAKTSTSIATSTQDLVSHIKTPEPLKSLYMTSWVAGTPSMRDHIIFLADTTEINSVVVDLKDYSGKISYPVYDPTLKAIGSSEKRIPSLIDLTNMLHKKGIYVIGRIACFQDQYFVKMHPEYAVKKNSNQSEIWRDYNGIPWLDPGEKPVWDYLISISKDAYAQGVDEIQFDYTRFPSDGNMEDIYYPASQDTSKSEIIENFWEYLNSNLKNAGIVTSVDLFGLTTTSKDDMGIGQIIENALKNFDYVSPMVYPSHFANGTYGFKNPQANPYDMVKISMQSAVNRAEAMGISKNKLRPWLQDFGLYGVTYGSKEIRDQIQAVYDDGLTSWLLWDPTNIFTSGALIPKQLSQTNTVNK